MMVSGGCGGGGLLFFCLDVSDGDVRENRWSKNN